MLFEFIQILLFVFYRVEVVNEFSNNEIQTTSDVSYDTSNYTSTDDYTDLTTTVTTSLPSSFRLDFYFTFINFQMYTLSA